MTRTTWISLAVVCLVMVVVGGGLIGSGHEIVGAVLIIIGAPSMGISIGRYATSRSTPD